MARPNLRFSIIIFGTALAYTVISWIIPRLPYQEGLNLPLLLVSLALMLVIAFVLEDRASKPPIS
jgi:hypothetical protein